MIRMNSPRFKAFTLIELLVVISIVALLISILLPALASARGSARNSQCLSNIKSQSIAVQMYAADFSEFVPPCYINGGTGTWKGAYGDVTKAYPSDYILLGRYTKNEVESRGLQSKFALVKLGGVWTCPDYNGINRVFSSGQVYSDYGLCINAYPRVDAGKMWSEMWRVSDAANASRSVQFSDSGYWSWHAGYTGEFYTMTDEQAEDTSYRTFNFGTPTSWYNPHVRHFNLKGTNLSFLDGHARSYTDLPNAYLAGELDIANPSKY